MTLTWPSSWGWQTLSIRATFNHISQREVNLIKMIIPNSESANLKWLVQLSSKITMADGQEIASLLSWELVACHASQSGRTDEVSCTIWWPNAANCVKYWNLQWAEWCAWDRDCSKSIPRGGQPINLWRKELSTNCKHGAHEYKSKGCVAQGASISWRIWSQVRLIII